MTRQPATPSIDTPPEPARPEGIDTPPPPEIGLKQNALGAPAIAFMVIAAAAPLTVMAGVAPLALSIGGAGAPVAYLVAGAAFAIFAVAFMAMTRATGGKGAFYSYITLGLGRSVGLGCGLLAVVAYNALQIGVYGLMAIQTQDAITRLFGITIEWPYLALAAIAIVWYVGRRGIDVGAKFLGVLLSLETGILLILAFAVLAQGGAHGIGFDSFHPSAVFAPGMGGILAFAFAAFMGFESTALYRSEARNPDRTIPRATYWAVGFMAIAYCFIVWSMVQAFGAREVQAAATNDVAGLFFSAMTHYVGTWATDVMSILIVTSALASQIAFHNAITRYTYSLARDGVLPAYLDRTHPVFRSPARAGALQTVIAAVVVGAFAIAGADPYYRLLLLVNTPGVVGIIALQLITAIAVVAYFARKRLVRVERVAVIAGIVSIVVLGVALAVLISKINLLTNADSTTNTWLVGLVGAVLLAGIAVAQYFRLRRPRIFDRIGGLYDDPHADTER
ncbi:putative amino acid transporter [Gordonia polyisoprenivorans NBRC 16320 = JCM 10675]|uniref:APC family permease n=1 Tax=Gordonia polyisoprenivorans TaxID=84595 RepID=A0A846WTB6_9ACTN|nr:APC family permease [Gordonia polyisoprenivorans]NKY04864.1 APC family permease [Gordonia polyisoprenivorans]GAB26488.1 putative amino acid transporter [Gordonia polyisoprenivorans NBRC 16320 = JCM 10675]